MLCSGDYTVKFKWPIRNEVKMLKEWENETGVRIMKVLIFHAKELNTGEFLISDMANFPFLCQDDGEMTPLKIA